MIRVGTATVPAKTRSSPTKGDCGFIAERGNQSAIIEVFVAPNFYDLFSRGDTRKFSIIFEKRQTLDEFLLRLRYEYKAEGWTLHDLTRI